MELLKKKRFSEFARFSLNFASRIPGFRDRPIYLSLKSLDGTMKEVQQPYLDLPEGIRHGHHLRPL